ncbi:MAG TPA: M20/M25/M40 family metallo-hydrolase, partial [Gammaproteobacteria bacterium]
YPQRAENAIHRIIPVLAELINTRWDQGNPDFPPTSFQISNFNAGTGAGNVIPGLAGIRFNFRYSPSVTTQELKQRTQTLLDQHGLRYELEWQAMGEPFLTRPGRLSIAVADSVREATSITPRFDTGGGTSDGRFIAPTGAEVVEFGPLNTSIHKINECVAVADLESLAEIYQKIMEKLLVN